MSRAISSLAEARPASMRILSVWPPRLTSAAGAISSADFTSSRLRVPAHLGQTQFRYDHEIFTLLPSTVSYGPSDGSLHVGNHRAYGTARIPRLSHGRQPHASSRSGGYCRRIGMEYFAWLGFAGPVRCDLRWQGANFPWQTQPVGTIEWGGEPTGASLLTPFLNQPVTQISARADLKPACATSH